jgi:hypothetical protein
MQQQSMIALLDYDFIFSQRKLLSPKDFARACKDRGLSLPDLAFGEDLLDAFHRSRVLVPLYRVQKDMAPAKAAKKLSQVGTDRAPASW